MTAQPTQPAADPDSNHRAEWLRHPERSNMFWLRVMTWISLRLGRSIGRLVLHLIALYFLVFGPRARRASKAYLARVLTQRPTWRHCYRHFFSFASTIHDRVYLINDRHDLFDVTVVGEDVMRDALRDGRGVLLLGAHMGSFEVLRAVGRRHGGTRVAMVMYEENARKINDALAAINPAAQADIIPLGRVDSMLAVRDRLAEGAMVGMLGDRTPGDEPTKQVPFLGDVAPFPTGPMRMAAMLRRPVLFMAGLYLGGNRYEVHFEQLADFSTAKAEGRGKRIDEALGAYVARLEHHCRRAPYNWFNFHDFWSGSGSSHDKKIR
jgi:predicted LPLAT superfamily acyltransferase